jgi:ribosomal protein S18 acetylase RimI-like enzyme
MMENEQITITALTEASSDAHQAVQNLAKKIGDNYRELTAEDFSDMITSPNTTVLVAKIGETIVGMITLFVYRIPYVKKAYLDDLAVDEAHRGKGIAKRLMNHAMNLAKEKGASYIDLTARPRRAEGNNLYENLGFKKRETNVYRLVFDYGEI